jgi:hypothetical protein
VVDDPDAAGDAVGPVPGDLNRGFACAVVVDVVAGLDPIDGVAEGSRGAVADGTDNLVHSTTARGDERLLALVEDGRQPIGAIAGMLAGAPVVENGDLLPHVGVTPVGDSGSPPP